MTSIEDMRRRAERGLERSVERRQEERLRRERRRDRRPWLIGATILVIMIAATVALILMGLVL